MGKSIMNIPSQKKMIRLSKSCLGKAEKQAVMGVLDREFLGMGEEVRKFEEALSSFFGRSAVCVVNGTAALHLALQCCGIGPGDEVLVPSLTYVASFQAISATGATPVACDIESELLTLDLNYAETKITSRTRAIMPVHYTGEAGNIDNLNELAKRYDLRVIEDAAHALGSEHQGKLIGGFGDIACFSFDGIKNITSGEGGCVVSKDENFLNCIRDARLLGVKKDTEKRFAGKRSWEFDVATQGWRYHMSNIMAAIGLEQLKRLPEMAAKRQKLARLYDKLLADQHNIITLKHDYSKIVPHIYIIRIKGLKDRKSLQKKLMDYGIQTGFHYQPNHWLSLYHNPNTSLPVTDSIFPELLTLPLHPDVADDDVDYVCAKLIEVLSV